MGKLGIIAGGGELPSFVANVAKNQGREVFLVAIKGITELTLLQDFDYQTVKLGQAGKALKILKNKGVSDLVFIGHIKRPSFKEIAMDFWTARTVAKWGMSIFGDNSLLSSIIKVVEKEGFKVIGIQDISSDFIAPRGVYGKVKPDKIAEIDIQQGYKIAKSLGGLDIGQSVIVQQGMVIGVEAIEGTDALIKRCKDLQRKGAGGVLVKTCKPLQDNRIDLPTVGINTLQNVNNAGLRGIAIEAGKSLIVRFDDFVKQADSLGLFVIGI